MGVADVIPPAGAFARRVHGDLLVVIIQRLFTKHEDMEGPDQQRH